ncbi:unnamed protein product [Dicrocoelium dendriticum]|nr:unnamed protein product [Dicrocoelium dendriticum]
MSEIDRTLENFLDEEDELSSDADLSTPASRSGWIFLLDCTPTMMGLDKHGSTNPTGFQLALRCCQTVQQNKAIASPKDMVGLVFMRTKKSSSSDLKNIYIVQPLDTVNAPRILELDAMLKLSPTELMSRYGALDKEPFDFHHALWTCQNMFSNSTKSMGYRHIFLFTDDPDPVNGRLHAKRQALAKVSDLHQSGIVFEVLPIKVEGVTFDFALFYQVSTVECYWILLV